MPSLAFLQSMELTTQPTKPKAVNSPTGFVLTTAQKGFLLVAVMGLLYLRLYRRRRKQDKICPHCGKRNPAHQTNCRECSAPLFERLSHPQ